MHIHHMVIGVVLVMVSGVTMVTLAVNGGVPEFTAAAVFFGIGAALVLAVEMALVTESGHAVALSRQAPENPVAEQPVPEGPREAEDILSAKVAAKLYGKRVEALSERTETSTTWV
ncbi:hypothetical protein, partial [Streptomyces sp. DSM 41978]|uniref:hypothetical protein n=1 Tax=Streptomyces sp. DSM 41978 TaxID=3448658 RepID=UPI0040403FAF